MRAMKKTVSVLLSIVMVLSVFTVLGITTAGAAETNTVTVTSNIGSGGDISYVPGTSEQVTVTFDFQTAKKLVAAEGVLTYDTNVLKLADSNTEATAMPNFTAGRMVNLTNPGRIKFVNTDIQSGYDFSTKSVFMTVVFDIIGSGDTTVALDVMEVSVADTFPSKTAASATKIIADSASTGTETFTSDNTAVATVDSATGEVTLKAAGTAIITAQAKADTNYNAGSATYLLTVEAPPTPTATGFSDVQDPKHAYYKAIYWAADAGITKGYPDGTFGINRDCTRGEMMMFLWRYAGKKEPTPVSKSPFKDVPKTHTFYKAILWGSQKGITKGYPDGTFGINKNVSRGECMMFLWRLKGKPAPKAVAKAPFPDVPKSHVFYNAVLWGYQKNITTGFTSGPLAGKFGVNENCSRGQIVTFLYRAKSL